MCRMFVKSRELCVQRVLAKHLVDEIYDNGRVLEQVRVPVMKDDTPESLAARVLVERVPPAINQVSCGIMQLSAHD